MCMHAAGGQTSKCADGGAQPLLLRSRPRGDTAREGARQAEPGTPPGEVSPGKANGNRKGPGSVAGAAGQT